MTMKLLSVLVLFLHSTNAARILGIFTMAGKSHFACNHGIMKSLHDAGHHVTMISPFPSEEKIENFTYVDSRDQNSVSFVGNEHTLDEFHDMSLYDLLNLTVMVEIQYCYDVIKLPEIQEALNSPRKLYDVLFFEALFAYECYLPIAVKLGIPVIATVTVNTLKMVDNAVGMPHNPATQPSISGSGLSTFSERIENIAHDLLCDYFKRKSREAIATFFREYHFSEELLHKKDISLFFYNNHASLLPRPTTPIAVEIGGVHVRPAQPLPKDLEKFIDEASHGVVLFTFGSVVKGSSLTLEKKEAFLAAFSSIPQRVLWKFEEPIENLPENIMLSNWLPQRDILEHKNVIAFISHCGQSGTYEAVMTGTPVITIPLFGDQLVNAALLRNQKVAVNIDFQSITKERILDALNTIINDTSYYQRMQTLSQVFKDRPMSPQESVVYWTEYVIRNNGTPYLKALGTDMAFYKYFMLDIAAFFILIMSIVIYVAYRGIRKIFNLILKKPICYTLIKKSE